MQRVNIFLEIEIQFKNGRMVQPERRTSWWGGGDDCHTVCHSLTVSPPKGAAVLSRNSPGFTDHQTPPRLPGRNLSSPSLSLTISINYK